MKLYSALWKKLLFKTLMPTFTASTAVYACSTVVNISGRGHLAVAPVFIDVVHFPTPERCARCMSAKRDSSLGRGVLDSRRYKIWGKDSHALLTFGL